ncbi:hypothetical protein QJS66_08715 [Kocuria rhizophila]|nr:hypothetical protein QJS66_08715 [Kocuria rhizophila]
MMVDFTSLSSHGCRWRSPMSPSHPMMPSTAPGRRDAHGRGGQQQQSDDH